MFGTSPAKEEGKKKYTALININAFVQQTLSGISSKTDFDARSQHNQQPSGSQDLGIKKKKKKSAQWKPPRGAEITSCRQEFLDCAWDQSANSCVASHHQEAAALRVGPYREKDESCTDNLARHPYPEQ